MVQLSQRIPSPRAHTQTLKRKNSHSAARSHSRISNGGNQRVYAKKKKFRIYLLNCIIVFFTFKMKANMQKKQSTTMPDLMNCKFDSVRAVEKHVLVFSFFPLHLSVCVCVIFLFVCFVAILLFVVKWSNTRDVLVGCIKGMTPLASCHSLGLQYVFLLTIASNPFDGIKFIEMIFHVMCSSRGMNSLKSARLEREEKSPQ